MISRSKPHIVGIVSVTVSGIPALALVTRYHYQRPLGPSAESDLDCYGFSECEYLLADRKSYLAPWLERKATKADREHIRGAIDEQMRPTGSHLLRGL